MIFVETGTEENATFLNPLDIILLAPAEDGALIYMIGRSAPVRVAGVPFEIAGDINAAIGIDGWLTQAYRWDGEAYADAWIALAHSTRIQGDIGNRIRIYMPGTESPWICEIPEGNPTSVAELAARFASQTIPTPIREVATYRSTSPIGAHGFGIESITSGGVGEAMIELSDPGIEQEMVWQCIAQIEGATAGMTTAEQTDSRTWRVRRFNAAGAPADLPWAARWAIFPA